MKYTIQKIQDSLQKKEISCQELVNDFLNKIEQDQLNDFISLFPEIALSQAQKIDQKIAQGDKLKNLEGVPIAIKDNILIKDHLCTAGSHILDNYVATYDAEVIKKLKSDGAIILGKTNLDEFAMGASNETSFFGPVLNPCDKTRVPGGSSGGSAVAVAAEHCVFSLGSDTGGSIRQPASFCGVTGLKPSYGRVSRRGLMSLSSSLDQIGPLTNSVEDAVIAYNSIIGKDLNDMTSRESEKINLDQIKKRKIKKIGIPQDYYQSTIDQNIAQSFQRDIQNLKEAGLQIEEVDLSFLDEALAIYYIIQSAEASTNLARYDGFRYGQGSDTAENLSDFYCQSRGAGFGSEVKRRIIMGTYVLSHGYKDAYYNQAKKIQADIKFRFKNIFQKVDLVLLPTTPNLAFKLNEKFNDPLTMYLSDIFTVAVNIAGLPAISIPGTPQGDLPIGLQIIGDFQKEDQVFNLAYFLENLKK